MGAPPGWYEAERSHTDAVIGTDTLGEMFAASARRNPDRDAQRYKGGVYDRSLTPEILPAPPAGEYGAITYERMAEVVRSLAAGLDEFGIGPDTHVGIFASTRMEWALADFALLSVGSVVTTVYTDSTPEKLRYLLTDSESQAVVVGTADLLDRLLQVADGLDIGTIVVMDEYATDRADIVTLADVHERGQAVRAETERESWLAERRPDDLASIIYTSGTTGKPKGVGLTHRNFRANVNQTRRRLGPRPDKGPELPTVEPGTTSIAFLPLAHVFERLAGHFFMYASGATVGYAESPDTLTDDFLLLRPDIGASVPRVYERIFQQMREQAGESPVKERVFDWALDVARQYARTEDPGPLLAAQHSVADWLVYSTVREGLGNNLDCMVSGGGSLSTTLCETFLGMGVTVIEGYGLTETAPVISINPPEDIRPGTLGVPVTELDVRIDESVVDGSEFETAGGPVGELLVDGPNVTDGYWNDPGATERSFSETDGRRWFRTGDIVERTDDDFLIYHDRLKQLLVLSTGKNVAPQPIEDLFSTMDRIEQIMVVGDDRKFVGALIVPNEAELERLAAKSDVDLPEDPYERYQSERVRAWIQEDVDRANRELERIERIKAFELVPEEWTVENELLTPSMKKKRRSIHEEFQRKVDRLYEE